MCTNILINNEINLENELNIDNSIEPEILTLEQLNSNMISRFNKQLKELDVLKSKLTKHNVELQHKLHSWIELLNYIKSLNLDEKISPVFLEDINKKVKAQTIWNKIIESQVETGVPYLCSKDSANRKTNHQNIGVIKQSNLCNEIYQYTDENTTAICTLSSMVLKNFIVNFLINPTLIFESYLQYFL